MVTLYTQNSTNFADECCEYVGNYKTTEALEAALDGISLTDRYGEEYVGYTYCEITEGIEKASVGSQGTNDYVFSVFAQDGTLFDVEKYNQIYKNASMTGVNISFITDKYGLNTAQTRLPDITGGIVVNNISTFADDVYNHIFEEPLVEVETFSAILATGYQQVELKGVLNAYNGYDTDEDTLTDWKEVDVEHWLEVGLITYNDDNTIKLPTVEQCMKFTEVSYVESALDRLQSDYGANFGAAIGSKSVMPIVSDPTEVDSDGDGFYDDITGEYSPIGYYEVKDEWLLTSEPNPAFYQKDGNYYFNRFTIDQTRINEIELQARNIGFVESGKSEYSKQFSEEIQNYIIEQCIYANEADYRENEDTIADPLLVLAICAHESNGEADRVNAQGAVGLMQFMSYDVCEYISDNEGWYEYSKNPEVKKLIDKACVDANYEQHSEQYQSIADDVASMETIVSFAGIPKINISLGIAKLSECYRSVPLLSKYKDHPSQERMYCALHYYCGVYNTYNEDLYIRNYLAKLIGEDTIYEDYYTVS